MLHQADGGLHVRVEELGANLYSQEILAVSLGIVLDTGGDAAGGQINNIGQINIGILLCIHEAQNPGEQGEKAQILLCNMVGGEDQVQVVDAVGVDIVVEDSELTALLDITVDGQNLGAQILSLQHRDLLDVLDIIGSVLILLQMLGRSHHGVDLLIGERGLQLFELLSEGLIPLAAQSLLGMQNHQGGVGIADQILTGQILKVALLHPHLEIIQDLRAVQMHKGLLLIVEPGVQQLQSPHQTPGKSAIVGLPKMELSHIDGRIESLLVNALLDLLFEGLLDDREKGLLLPLICPDRKSTRLNSSHA